jgi:hypothetical protein
VLDHWGDCKGVINLTKHWSKVLLNHACAWQRDTFHWCLDNNDLTSMQWLKALIENACDINLVKCIDEKFDALLHHEQEGITNLKIV